jgi:phosphoribosyl-AMP cyclohydrolase
MTLKEIEHIDFKKGEGIVPVIVQDSTSKDILTLAYTN